MKRVAGLAVLVTVALAPPARAAEAEAAGATIAFVSSTPGIENTDVFTVADDGRGLRQLTTDAGGDGGPAWSPDGSRIAFSSTRGGSADIWVMAADGTGEVRLTDHPAGEWGPAWSPDGARIAFTSDRDGDWRTDPYGTAAIYVMAADGSGVRRVTDPAIVSDRPAWSPDGSRIVFTSDRDGDPELFVVDATGGSPVQITHNTAADRDPAWSPDGTRIAFSRDHGFDGDVYVIAPDGSAEANLTGFPGIYEVDPAWSPSGSHLVIVRQGDLWIIAADGSGARPVTSGGHYWDPEWRPWPTVPSPVGLVDPATGRWYLRGRTGETATFYFGNPGDVPFVGDWDCDGVDTPGLYRPGDGFVHLRNSNIPGVADLSFFYGNPGDVPLAGDFDGDGCDTVALYRPSEGRVFVANRLGSGSAGIGAADAAYYFGDPGDAPFAGDFDGDGIDTIGLHREATGLVYFRNDHTAGVAAASFVFGDPGDRMVTGDWGGNGRDTVAAFRPSLAEFLMRFSHSAGWSDARVPFGDGAWLPVAGEFGLDP